VLITAVLNILMTEGKNPPLYHWRFITVYKEGLILAAFMILRLVFLIIGTSLLTLTTSPIELTDGIEKLLNPLKGIGVPAHELAMMMTIALRFIPTLMDETDKIMKAQMARGADFESGNIIRRARNLIPILVPLFISSFRRADELAMAMEARCYKGGEGRTRMKQLKLTNRDFVASLSIICLVIISVWSRMWI
jgi:energy-coupling factor transport system permease protein